MRKRLNPVLAVLIGIMLLAANAAYAVPVGKFVWDDDMFNGSVFTVENYSSDPSSLGGSGISFLDVFVNIETDSGIVNLVLGNVDPGLWMTTFDDLTSYTILSASLSMTPLPGLTTPTLFMSGDIGIIDYQLPMPAPAPSQIPEPSTVLLFGAGMLSLVFVRIYRIMGKMRATTLLG